MSGRLIERGGERTGLVHVLGSDVTTIGRSEENQIAFPSDHISRRHAEVRWDGSVYVLHDLGSKNGTFLNGSRITEPQPLQHGDTVSLAGHPLSFDLDEETVQWTPQAAHGEIRIDAGSAMVFVSGRQVSLSVKEYLALTLLYERGGLVTKEELAAGVWPEYQGAVNDYNIEQLISRLRRKLEDDAEQPRYLLTVRGLGYRLGTS